MKTKLFLLFLIFTTSMLNAQIVNNKSVDDVVNIPDPYFKALMLYLFDTNNDNEIQVVEAEAATGSIYMDYTEEDPGLEQSLVGIEAFINITGLHIHYCPIEVIDLSQNLALEVINCSHNSLTSLSLGNNTTLKELDCGDNLLTSIDINQNTGLEVFDCRENELANIDVSNCTNLIDLRIGSNQLTNLEINLNSNLEYLNCSNNNISSINISNNTFLEYLLCGENELTELNVGNNLSLSYLWCKYNLLSSINLSLNSTVRYINCSYNHLTFLDVRNGNNANFDLFIADSNPDLSCIFVDDIDYSTDHWLTGSSHFLFDPNSHFVETQEQCDAIGIEESIILDNLIIYPNPTYDSFTIESNVAYSKLKIYNELGVLVVEFNKQQKYSISNLKAGVYMICIDTPNGTVTKKIIKNLP